MGVQSWRVGEVKITKIVESEGPFTFPLLPEATPEALLAIDWLRPHFVTESGEMILSMHALLVEAGGLKIVVDTCVGNDKERFGAMHMLRGPFLDDFERIACRREEVDIVLCTHLHVDHVGWNTMLVDGEWRPTFPNARYLFARTEYDHWRREAALEGDEPARFIGRATFMDSVKPVMDAGQVDLVETTHVLTPEVRLIPTYGHTPGHVSVEITSEGQRAVITGDMMHHPCQLRHPQWRTAIDYDIEAGVATRQLFCEQVADTDTLVIGTHWATPTAGQVVREGPGYRLRTGTAASS